MMVSFEDRDNFVRDLVTIALPDGTFTQVPVTAAPASAPLSSAVTGPPVLTLAEVKAHLRIELSFTDEDDVLTLLEKAARLQVQNDIRREIDAAVGENVKLAMLLLVGHWYRHREAVATGTTVAELPLAYKALLFAERDFPAGTY